MDVVILVFISNYNLYKFELKISIVNYRVAPIIIKTSTCQLKNTNKKTSNKKQTHSKIFLLLEKHMMILAAVSKQFCLRICSLFGWPQPYRILSLRGTILSFTKHNLTSNKHNTFFLFRKLVCGPDAI